MSEQAAKEVSEAIQKRMSARFTIELDCPPGGIRPSDLIGNVIKGTGLPERDPISKCFGEWTYDYTDVEGIAELWPKIQPTLKERVSALYNRGTIRYGSW